MFTQFQNYALKNVGVTAQTLVTVPATNQYMINQLSLSNVTNRDVNCSVTITRAGVVSFLARDAVIPPNGSLACAGRRQTIVLMAGDVVQVQSSTPTSIDAIVSGLLNDFNPTATIPAPVVTPIPPAPYPTVNTANELFRFTMETGTLSNLLDTSPNAWTPPLGTRGATNLSTPTGGPFGGAGRFLFNNLASNTAGISTISDFRGLPSAYGVYHNDRVPTQSWTLESHVQLLSNASLNRRAGLWVAGTSSIEIRTVTGSTTQYQLTVVFSLNNSAANGTGAANIPLPAVVSDTWYHLVVTCVLNSPGNFTTFAFINGVLQGSANFTTGSTFALFASQTDGAYVGVTPQPASQAFYLDNIRMVTGAPFALAGFTPPTGAFTA